MNVNNMAYNNKDKENLDKMKEKKIIQDEKREMSHDKKEKKKKICSFHVCR